LPSIAGSKAIAQEIVDRTFQLSDAAQMAQVFRVANSKALTAIALRLTYNGPPTELTLLIRDTSSVTGLPSDEPPLAQATLDSGQVPIGTIADANTPWTVIYFATPVQLPMAAPHSYALQISSAGSAFMNLGVAKGSAGSRPYTDGRTFTSPGGTPRWSTFDGDAAFQIYSQ